MTTGIPDLLFAIKQALAANDPGTATRLCKKVLSKSPNDLQALAFLGIAYLKMGNVDEAIQRFRRCTQIAPADFSAFENLGIALAESGDSIAGLEALKRSAELGNPSARLLANIGSLCLQIGDYDGAAAALENALRQLPANIELLTQLSVALARTGSWQTARQYAGQALALDPKTYRTHMFDGFVNLRPPNLDHAIAAFGAALNQPIEARREQLRVQELLADTIMCRDLFPAARERRASLTRTPVDAGGQALGPDGAASALALGDAVANQRDAAAGLAPSRAGQAARAVSSTSTPARATRSSRTRRPRPRRPWTTARP
jgi:Flp pilus assembly protein TadD